jgi:hypothetical protein
VVLALVLLVTLPSVAIGFITDDYGFRAQLAARGPHAPAVYDLFRLVSGSVSQNRSAMVVGRLPWWSAPDLRIHFIRPLTSLLFAADNALFGDHAFAYHLHSIAWYVALLLALAALYRRLFPDGWAAPLALLVFGWSRAHAYAYAWPSARHVLVAAVPAVLAVMWHVRWREEAWRPGRDLAPVALVGALAASEAGLAGAIYWLAYELLGRRGRPHRERFLASAPVVLIVPAYVTVYSLLHGGARASGGYHDPFVEPVAFMKVALTRVPILLGDAALGIPSEAANVLPPTYLALAGLVAVGFVGLGLLGCHRLLVQRERDALVWLLPGALVSTLLGVSAFPGGRVLVLPDVGFAAVLGVLVAHGLERGSRRLLRGAVAFVLVLAHLVIAPVSSLRSVMKLRDRGRASEAAAQEIAAATPSSGYVFLLASDPLVFLYPRGILAVTQPGVVRCASALSAARSGHRIRRVDYRTLQFEAYDRPLLDGSFDSLFRSEDRPFSVGDTVRQCGASFRVTQVREGRPTAFEVKFDRSLEAADLRILVWSDGHLGRVAPPAIGGTTDVPWSPGPSRM